MQTAATPAAPDSGKSAVSAGQRHVSQPQLTLPIRDHPQTITGTPARTYRALLTYLQVGHIVFAPLTTSFFSAAESQQAASSGATEIEKPFEQIWFMAHEARKTTLLHQGEASIMASSKSIYRLADTIGLDGLKRKAKDAYLSRITPEVSRRALEPVRKD